MSTTITTTLADSSTSKNSENNDHSKSSDTLLLSLSRMIAEHTISGMFSRPSDLYLRYAPLLMKIIAVEGFICGGM